MDLVSVTQCAADFHSRLNSSCGSSYESAMQKKIVKANTRELARILSVTCYTTLAHMFHKSYKQ